MSEAYAKQLSLGKLTSKHRNLMRDIITNPTMTNAELGARCDFSPIRVGQLKNSELFKSELDRMEAELDKVLYDGEAASRAEVRGAIDKEVMNSLAVIVKLRDDIEESGQVRQKSALEILSLAGHKAPEAVSQVVTIEMDEGLKAMLSDAISGKKGAVAETVGEVSMNVEGEATTGGSNNVEG